MSITKDLIRDLRGGAPEKCDWCGKDTSYENLVPCSGGEWACIPCVYPSLSLQNIQSNTSAKK